jgi:hypothetical protein
VNGGRVLALDTQHLLFAAREVTTTLSAQR